MTNRDVALRDAGLAFMGKVVAAQTHEVTNAFSVINEMAGLQQDILQDAARGEPLDLLELERVSGKIREHVRRGDAVVRSINWIAHSADRLSAAFAVNEALERAVAAAEHWMRRRRARFALSLPEEGARLETRPFFFVYAVLLAADIVTPPAAGDQEISVSYTRDGDGITLVIANVGAGSSKIEATNLKKLNALVEAMGGALRRPRDGGPAERIVIIVPHGRPAEERDTKREETP